MSSLDARHGRHRQQFQVHAPSSPRPPPPSHGGRCTVVAGCGIDKDANTERNIG
jgi:hypothetical protein